MNGPVIILDDLEFKAEDAEPWLDRWRHEYLPAARARGLRLEGIWRGATRDPAAVSVVIQWSLPSVEDLGAARRAVLEDRQPVLSFWDATDATALSRDRRILAAESLG